MPRLSAAALAAQDINAYKRPEPPDTLDEEAAEEWRKVVSMLPADWFPPETHSMLEDRCRQVVWLRQTHKDIEQLIQKKNYSRKEYYFLIKLASGQSRTIGALDTKMRLTQQSSYETKFKRKHSSKGPLKPWSNQDQDQDEAE